MNRQVFWSTDWSLFRRGRAALVKAGFTATTVRTVIKANGLTCWCVYVPLSEFRKANKLVRTF